MRLEAGPEAIPPTTTDDEIRAAVAQADLPALLVAVATLTGDRTLLREEFRPDPSQFLDPDAGISPATAAAAREEVVRALARYRDGGCVAAPPPDEGRLRAAIDFLVGGGLDDDYFRLLEEELALGGRDHRAPRWHKDDVAPGVPFTVAIVGAGMSGIAAAHRLDQAGVPFVVFEKNPEVGGTWWENRYPGCRVDVPNHLYSYSFAQTDEWPGYYSTQAVLLDYFRSCVDHFGLRDRIRFGTEVLGADWDDSEQCWTVRVATAGGAVETHRFQALVSAVGQLNRPKFPDIPGRDTFAGPAFHSAEWDDTVELAGRRVGVIGTGASAAQFIPPVAQVAGELVVFQRTPPWLLPVPNYQAELPEGVRWLLRHVPDYAHWNRLWIFWRMHEGLLPAAVVDPEWEHRDRSVSAANDVVREFLTAYLRASFPDDALFEKVVPRYPPIAKRIVLDNGVYPAALARENVRLVTEPIAEITEKGVRTCDGVEYQLDVLIYGTGFQASNFLVPMRIRGRGGADLHETWGPDARAYLGLTVPGFPNLFLMYGPNTNIVVNGSIIYFSECEAHYIVESVRMLLERGCRSMDVRRDVHDAYNEAVDAQNARMAWGASSVNTWYKSATGRISQNWPFSLLEYWQRTRVPDPGDYELR
ncbi:MAG: monooxygenase [Acidimicrobiia bacterium]|nr:MAG: monooxygenase [Acidimicrobiia bacterium]